MFKFFRKKLERIKQRVDTLRQMYQNRGIIAGLNKDKIKRCRIIWRDEGTIKNKAEYWKKYENEDKYEIDALLEYEFMSIIDEKERELIRKGARLRQELMEECVNYFK